MSGNSGSGSPPSINRPGTGEDCSAIVINTHISTPKALVIATLSEGDVLQLRLVSDQGPLQVITHDGRLAGNIISRDQNRLVSCFLEGFDYEAVVLEVDGAEVQIQIRAV